MLKKKEAVKGYNLALIRSKKHTVIILSDLQCVSALFHILSVRHRCLKTLQLQIKDKHPSQQFVADRVS